MPIIWFLANAWYSVSVVPVFNGHSFLQAEVCERIAHSLRFLNCEARSLILLLFKANEGLVIYKMIFKITTFSSKKEG